MKQEKTKRNPSRREGDSSGLLSLLRLYLDKLVFWLVLFLLFFTPIFLIPGIITHDTVIHSKEVLVLFVSCTAAAIAAFRIFFLSRGSLIHKDPVRIALLGYGLAMIVSALFSGEPLYSLRECIRTLPLLMLFLVFPELFRSFGTGKKSVREGSGGSLEKIRLVTLTAAGLTSIYGLCQYFGFDFIYRIFRYSLTEDIARNYILSTIGNPEYLGSYLSPLILLCLVDVLRPLCSRDEKAPLFPRIMGIFLCLVFLCTLFLSGARGAVIGLVAGAALTTILLFPRIRTAVGGRRLIVASVAIAGFILAFVIVFSFPNPINRRNQNILGRFRELFNLRSTSVKERILFYSIGADLIAQRPVFGVGEGMFRVKFYPTLEDLSERDERAGVTRFIYELRNRVADNAHNDLLQIWIENGIVGFMSFSLGVMLLFAGAFSRISRDLKSGERGGITSLHLCFTAAAFCLLVNAGFSFPMHTPTRSVLFWCLLGATHAATISSGYSTLTSTRGES